MPRNGKTERLGDILGSLLQRRAYARPLAIDAWGAAWLRAAGERLAARTRVTAIRDGILTVEVGSAAQRYELEAFHAPELLRALQADPTVGPLRRLVFRTGNATT